MGNPFQDQLLKAGIVSKKQVQKANQEKSKAQKKKRHHNQSTVDVNKIKTQQLAEKKAKRDRELNLQKEQQTRNKAISIEINQLINDNRISRDDNCEIIYNFEHNKKINRIHVNQDMKSQIVNGRLGIARIEGRYELIPASIAEKIKQRNKKRVVLFEATDEVVDENDPYAEYQIPDDLNW